MNGFFCHCFPGGPMFSYIQKTERESGRCLFKKDKKTRVSNPVRFLSCVFLYTGHSCTVIVLPLVGGTSLIAKVQSETGQSSILTNEESWGI